MSQCDSVIIDRGINEPGNGKEVVDGLNAAYTSYIYKFISNVQLPGTKIFDSQMQMHTGNQNNYVSLAKEFQQHLKKEHRKNGVIAQGKYKKYSWKENGQIYSIMFRIMLMLRTKM